MRSKGNTLREVAGDRIRWQYFTGPIILLVFCMLFVPYCMFVFYLIDGKLDWSVWLSDLLVCVEICLAFSIPFIFLAILNRFFFGKIICVINENGIHHKDGTVKWSEIVKIEYEIQFPSSTVYRSCHAIIHTRQEKIVLVHAPLVLLSKARKYSPNTRAGVSKSSKWMIGVFIALPVIVVPLIPWFM